MKRRFLIAALLLVVFGIIALSVQSSGGTVALTAFYRTHFPHWLVYPKIKIAGNLSTVRQAMHLYEYLLLGILSGILCIHDGTKRVRNAFFALLFCCVFSNLDQLIRFVIPGREYDAMDLLYDAIGYINGILVVQLVYTVYKKLHSFLKNKINCKLKLPKGKR